MLTNYEQMRLIYLFHRLFTQNQQDVFVWKACRMVSVISNLAPRGALTRTSRSNLVTYQISSYFCIRSLNIPKMEKKKKQCVCLRVFFLSLLFCDSYFFSSFHMCARAPHAISFTNSTIVCSGAENKNANISAGFCCVITSVSVRNYYFLLKVRDKGRDILSKIEAHRIHTSTVYCRTDGEKKVSSSSSSLFLHGMLFSCILTNSVAKQLRIRLTSKTINTEILHEIFTEKNFYA